LTEEVEVEGVLLEEDQTIHLGETGPEIKEVIEEIEISKEDLL
jgi:hypothetical protein